MTDPLPSSRSVHVSGSVADTEAVAAEMARSLAGGTTIALHGDLGAGKTQFVRGLVRALGGNARAVSSPTYVLLHVYGAEPNSPQRLRVYHLDAYRIHGPEDLDAIGFSELLADRQSIVVVEWASRVLPLLPVDYVAVTIESTGVIERRITIERIATPTA